MWQILLNGFITGLLIAVLALAFTVVYLPTRIFFLGLGGIYVAVPFVAWTFLQRQWSWHLTTVVAVLAGILLSVACELINHGPLENKSASSGAHFVSSLGIYILVVQGTSMIWGNETKVLRTGLDAAWEIGQVTITRAQFVAATGSIFVLVIFFLCLRWLRAGLHLRALASNPIEMALRGYNVRVLRLMVFGLSGLLASVCALFVSLDLGLNPQGGLSSLLLAIVAAVIGGRGTFIGPVLGGLLVGVVRAFAMWFVPAQLVEMLTFLLLITFLIFWQDGLLGCRDRLESQA